MLQPSEHDWSRPSFVSCRHFEQLVDELNLSLNIRKCREPARNRGTRDDRTGRRGLTRTNELTHDHRLGGNVTYTWWRMRRFSAWPCPDGGGGAAYGALYQDLMIFDFKT